MSNRYFELKEKHQNQINKFPKFFAFSTADIEDGKEKLGVDSDSDLKSIGYNMFIRKCDSDLFNNMIHNHRVEFESNMTDDDFLYDMFIYEMANHEFCITGDIIVVLNSLGITINELESDIRLQKACIKAIKYIRDNTNYFLDVKNENE